MISQHTAAHVTRPVVPFSVSSLPSVSSHLPDFFRHGTLLIACWLFFFFLFVGSFQMLRRFVQLSLRTTASFKKPAAAARRTVATASRAPALNFSARFSAPVFSPVRFFSDDVKPAAAASHVGSSSAAAPKASSSGKPRETGIVKWFDSSKGFGFIVRDKGDDIFVHFTSIQGDGYRSLEEGQRVEFSVGTGHKGPIAQDVTLA